MGAALAACAGESVAPLATPVVTVEAPSVAPQLDERVFVVEAEADGRVVRMLVDTGAGASAFDAARSRELGFARRELDASHTVTGSNGTVERVAHAALVDELRIGAARVGGLELLEVDLGRVGIELDGIVGWDVLSQLAILGDTARGELHLLPGGHEAIVAYLETGPRPWPAEWTRLPLLERDDPTIEFAFDEGPTVDLRLDTGATGISFPSGVLEGLGLDVVGTNVSGTATGRHESDVYAMKSFEIAEWRFACHVHGAAKDYGLLGMELLGEFVFVVDGPGRELWLTREDGSD
jgi:predicted aspartyl protease